jgi:hypothetical protein
MATDAARFRRVDGQSRESEDRERKHPFHGIPPCVWIFFP